MNDKELDRAIRTTHALIGRTVDGDPMWIMLTAHLNALLSAQANRADTPCKTS